MLGENEEDKFNYISAFKEMGERKFREITADMPGAQNRYYIFYIYLKFIKLFY